MNRRLTAGSYINAHRLTASFVMFLSLLIFDMIPN